jgi:hypothetical protein
LHPCGHRPDDESRHRDARPESPRGGPRPELFITFHNGRALSGNDISGIKEQLSREWRRAAQIRRALWVWGGPLLLLVGVLLEQLVIDRPFVSPFSQEVTDRINATVRSIGILVSSVGLVWLLDVLSQSAYRFIRGAIKRRGPARRKERSELSGRIRDFNAETISLLVDYLTNAE